MSNLIADKLRWGILGTADIARKNWLAILNSGNSVVAAVASRDLQRARHFIRHCQSHAPMPAVPQAIGSYAEMVASRDIDAVYMPLPTALRKEWVLRAAAAGKHIVCEKPCASNLAELQEMLKACRRHGVQFMDGVMFMHSARLGVMRQALDEPDSIGAIRRITSAFTFCAEPEFFTTNIRAQTALEPQGCLGDLGWYNIRFSLWALRWQSPVQVTGRILSQWQPPDGSPPLVTEFAGELLFRDGVSAGFFCSFLAHDQEWAQISGTAGYLQVEDFVVPFAGNETGFVVHKHEFTKNGCEFKMEPRLRRASVAEHSQANADAQETNQFREFARQARSGQLNHDWPAFALQTQAVMEACLSSARRGGEPFEMESL